MCLKGHVKLDMTPSNAHDPEAVLNTLANYCYSLEEATRYFSWNEIIDAMPDLDSPDSQSC